MSVTIAEGVVKVTADGKAVGDDLSNSLKGAEGKADGAGKGFGSKLLGGIGTVFKTGALAVGAVAATGIGVALTKGFSRLNAIDQARAKLEGLGNSTQQIDKIMTNALASVKGTAFGLDEAGTTAASAVAAGIQPGAQLEGVLKTIADTATIAGASMSDTGAIFNSVAARGKLQGDDLMQLQERGVPVLAFLAKHYGTTAAAASDMVSKGEVDFANFSAAMQENLGGAALSSGKTFQGALANVMASFGRIGAGLLGGIFPSLAPALTSITQAMAPLEAGATKVGAAIGSVVAPAIQGFAANVGRIPQILGPIFSGIGTIFAPLGAALMQLGQSVLQILPNISPLSLIFQSLMPVLPQIASLVSQLATVLVGLLGSALSAVAPLVSQVASVLIQLLSGVFVALMPVVTSLIQALMPVLTSLAPLFGVVVQAIMPLVTTIASILIPVIQMLMPVIQSVFSAIVPIIQAAMQIIQGVIQVVTGIISGNWSQVWNGIKNILSGVWNAIKAVISGALGIIGSVIGAALGGIRGVFSAVWNGVKSVVSGATNGIVSAVRSMAAGIGAGISSAVSFFLSLPGKINGALAGAASWLVGVGRNIIEGLISGVKAAASGIADAVLGPIKNSIEGVKSFLGIHSPSRLFRDEIGAMMGQGVAVGFTGEGPGITKAITSTLAAALPAAQTSMSAGASAAASTPTSIDRSRNMGGITINEANDPLGTVGRLQYAWDTQMRGA